MTIPQHGYWIVCLSDAQTEQALAAQAKLLGLAKQPVICAAWGDAPLPLGADAAVLLPDAGGDACAMGAMLSQALAPYAPEAVLAPATVLGRAVLAWTAARLETGLTADCTALSLTADGLLLQTRPAFGGRMIADILCREKRPQMATVRPGMLTPPALPDTKTPHVLLDLPHRKYLRRIGEQQSDEAISLSEAEVIIAGGKGIGCKEGFTILRQLAGLLGGAVGATRAAVDAGYAPYSCQIGQTGRVVRPRLYIAVAIHGAVQHTLGMDGAKQVIAINTDPSAPIFAHANYGILSDWREAIEKWIKDFEKELEK